MNIKRSQNLKHSDKTLVQPANKPHSGLASMESVERCERGMGDESVTVREKRHSKQPYDKETIQLIAEVQSFYLEEGNFADNGDFIVCPSNFQQSSDHLDVIIVLFYHQNLTSMQSS